MTSLNLECSAFGWKAVFAAMNSLHEEASFMINEMGVRFYCIDGSHNSVLELEMEKSWFDKFEFDEPHEVAFKISEMNKIFGRIKADDKITIEQQNEAYLGITVGDKRFESRLLFEKFMVGGAKTPKVEHQNTVTILYKDLAEYVKDAKIFNQEMQILFADGEMFFKAKEDKGIYNAKISEGNYKEFLMKISTDYFMKVIDPISTIMDEQITIHFGRSDEKNQAVPTLFAMAIPRCGCLKYWLAAIEPPE